ncbi:DNA-processing protein DprA [Heyndrickxia sp. NPDC080065]|uniref:DNA-processing protein DprA n=1 Tax=Heyndrickxia sp. NPDC080065 TaxID=3390568 RepID=UPI003CFF6264
MDLYWIWLSMLKNVGPVIQKRLLTHFRTPKYIYDASEKELISVNGMRKQAIASIINNRSLKEAEKITNRMVKNNIRMLTIDDHRYPEKAKDCKESPAVLYYKGNLKSYQTAIAIVGSRRCTSYGRKVAEEIGAELALLKIPVISGFAKGVDSYAHFACVKQGGYPIVFLAGGVDVCYPNEQQLLYEKIVETGVILSQYPPGSVPKPKQFLQRNSLISAWASEVIVVEAGKSSGALWTANFAKKQGRKVYAVPNQIHVPEGEGTNQLISQGAAPYLGIKSLDSIKGMTIKNNQNQEPKSEIDPILSILSESPHSLLELSKYLKINIPELTDKLLNLELQRKIIIRGNMIKKL